MHPRSDVFGDALPRNADGTPRPLLGACRYLTVHWVGAGKYGDPGDTPDEMRAIQSYATGANKGWEYNWVVDGEGQTWEYAGAYQAAHSAGENAIAIGVLLLAGPGDEITDAMVLGVRRLRWELEQRGALRADYELRPHQQMPGAATACPGPAMARWGEIATPWSPPVPPPDPEPIEEDDVKRIRYRDRRYHNQWLLPDGLHLTPVTAGVWEDCELVEDEHDVMLRSLVNISGITADDLAPR